MFTTIKTLRESSAEQSRVTKVRTALLKLNPSWTDDAPFPIMFIAISNGYPDFDWVWCKPSLYVKITGWTGTAQKDFDSKMPQLWNDTLTPAKAKTYLELIKGVAEQHKVTLPFFATPGTSGVLGGTAVSAPAVKTPAVKLAAVKTTPLAKPRPYGGKGTVPMMNNKPAGHNTPTNNFKGKVTPAAKTSSPELKKDMIKLQDVAIKTGIATYTKHAESLRIVPKKPLPVPSVLKQIRDLVKSHPKIKVSETKGAPGTVNGSTLTVTY